MGSTYHARHALADRLTRVWCGVWCCGAVALWRQTASQEVLDMLAALRKKVVVGMVGGSDLDKQKEQLGEGGEFRWAWAGDATAGCACGCYALPCHAVSCRVMPMPAVACTSPLHDDPLHPALQSYRACSCVLPLSFPLIPPAHVVSSRRGVHDACA